MNPKIKKSLDEAYEQLMQISLNQVPLEGLEELVHPNVMGFGTTVSEEVYDQAHYIRNIKNQEDYAVKHDLDFNFDREIIHEYYSPDHNFALFVEKIKTTIRSKETVQEYSFRFSAIMELIDGQWKLIHWHGSLPADIGDDIWHFEEWKIEKERLEQKVAEQTAALQDKNKELVIVASLERVRGKSMAMQHSNELSEVIQLLHKELLDLGVDHDSAVIMTYPDDKKLEESSEIWIAVEGQKYFTKFNFPYVKDSPISDRHRQAILDKVSLYTDHFTKEEKDHFFKYQFEHGDLKHLPEERKRFILDASGYVRAAVSLKNSGLFINRYNDQAFSEYHLSIIEQFGKVFEQAYTRFLDLQKAEQLAYEAKVEASLEKVRGMASAMNHSDDLMQLAEAMFQEMEILQINPLRYGLAMINEERMEADLWASTVNDGHFLDMLGIMPLDWHPMLQQSFNAWQSQHEELIYELKGEELSNYYQRIEKVNPGIPGIEELKDPNTAIVQYVNFFPFNTGVLYAFTDGEPSEEGKSILKRFANVFEQAHIRFEDLRTTEQQALMISQERDRLEKTLNELKATQEQLIQQEKLASLGQLTAGIAHEIKNPLNFVNNFSDLSSELINEIIEELASDEPDFEYVSDVLGDVSGNLKKIFEHGTRADNIVKSMLEHSRGGSGVMEPTPLNSLLKEYVNLAFHGMRASKEPINMDLQLDLNEEVGQVPLIAEDFSRVIINLCNNAFDAMREKLESSTDASDDAYQPKLIVRTHHDQGKVVVEVEDNGPGIPDEIKDKIMQPFFTTKKGTAGTGLGLSITNDIIKAHGGWIEIQSRPHISTTFAIHLENRDTHGI